MMAHAQMAARAPRPGAHTGRAGCRVNPVAPARRSGGFTLIEVLVALVIVALGMAAVLQALDSAADTTSYLRTKTFAQWIGFNRIARVRLQSQKPSTGTTSTGEIEFAGRRWHWRQQVTRWQLPGMLRVTVEVRPQRASGGSGDKIDDDDHDASWTATVSGLIGTAVAPPSGTQPSFDLQASLPQGSGDLGNTPRPTPDNGLGGANGDVNNGLNMSPGGGLGGGSTLPPPQPTAPTR